MQDRAHSLRDKALYLKELLKINKGLRYFDSFDFGVNFLN